jgi:putative sugar O-methyltransferase
MLAGLHQTTTNAPQDLALMLKAMSEADEIYRPSPFWEGLALEHIHQLETQGFANFKRTVNLRYFNWGVPGILAHQLLPLGRWWLMKGHGNPLAARIVQEEPDKTILGRCAARIYAMHVAMLHQRVQSEDSARLLDRCSESLIGNPIQVRVGKLVVTQDLCNSVHEYIHATQFTDMSKSPLRVLEIGAGYGRLATLFLDVSPTCKYWIVDIPPALYISQRYLSEVYPEKKIFKFRPIARFSDVVDEVQKSDVCFFMSSQIDMLPEKSIDIALCISNLHEMTKEQIAHYFHRIDRMTRGTFYTKQWLRSIAKENGFTISRSEYPVLPNWMERFNVRHPIQSWFFEAAYQIQ